MNRSLTWANQLAEIGLTNQLFNNGIKRSWLLCGERWISWSPSGPLARLALGTGYTRAQRTFTAAHGSTDRLLQRTKDISSAPTTTPPPQLQIAFQRTPKLGNTLISSPSSDVWMDNWFRIIVYGREANCSFKVLECFSVLEVGKVL